VLDPHFSSSRRAQIQQNIHIPTKTFKQFLLPAGAWSRSKIPIAGSSFLELPGSSNSAKHTHTHKEILSNSFFISQQMEPIKHAARRIT
jgi:hypothetical protein